MVHRHPVARRSPLFFLPFFFFRMDRPSEAPPAGKGLIKEKNGCLLFPFPLFFFLLFLGGGGW